MFHCLNTLVFCKMDSFSITYPFFFLQLPQLHVLHTLLLVGLLNRRNLFKTFRSLKVINLWRQREMSNQDPRDVLTPASLRFMTFFSWFLRRSWSSFFSFSSCSTCFAIMKSGSSSSRSYKNSCGRRRITSELHSCWGVVLLHHIPTLTPRCTFRVSNHQNTRRKPRQAQILN